MKYVFLGLFLFLPWISAFSLNEKKQLGAVRTTTKITIDGLMNEPVWENAQAATGFVTYSPTMGLPETQRTEVRVVYDNKAVYFGIHLFDTAPDSIMRELTKRDQVTEGNVDWFKISLNPYNDGQNLFQFEVSAANVQGDSKRSSSSSGDGEEMYHHGDPSWNTVWYSKANITEDGWMLEVEIPFSAIRFPKLDVQVWGINFQRTVRRTRETTTWNPVDRNFGEESQVGELLGIQSVKSPIRLELYPFAAGYYQFSPEGKGFSYAAGMDLKYGINDAYTLDMTLIPDFGQRKSDRIILNLTPYEVQYQENRQFFTEGMELFDKSGLFYSRRIGKTPAGYEDVKVNEGEVLVQNPEEAKLINVTKISGRNTKNLGVGFLNAMTANTYAKITGADGTQRRVLTDPFSNYNVLVLDQVFGRNSFINLTNTNVMTPSTTRMANVTNIALKLRDRANRFGVSGSGAVSLIYDSLSGKPVAGHSMNFSMGKYGGAFIAAYNFGLVSDTYNPNDMGYLRNNNMIGNDITVSHRFLEPFWILNNLSNSLEIEYNMIYNPRAYSEFHLGWSTDILYRNYWDTRISLEYSPVETHDWYEPRVAGRYFVRPSYLVFELGGSSDYRKKVAFNAEFVYFSNERGNRAYQFGLSPRFRLNNKFSFFPSVEYLSDHGDEGFVTSLNNGSLVFGKRNIKNVTNSLTGSYVFNNTSSLSLSFRHYWSQVNYLQYYLLDSNGGLMDYPSYPGNENLDFNIFNIDLEYALNFAPGSYLTVVWKNSISKSETADAQAFLSYWDNLRGTLVAPQTNSFSIKVIYYLDYKRVLPGKNP